MNAPHCSLQHVYDGQDMEAAWVSINGEDVVYMYSGVLLSHQREKFAICSNMDGPRNYYAG